MTKNSFHAIIVCAFTSGGVVLFLFAPLLLPHFGCSRAAPAMLSRAGRADLDKGLALAKEAKHEEAVQEFNKAIDANPKNADAYRAAGDSNVALGRLDDAVSAYRRGISISPDDASLHHNLGLVYAMQGKYDDAVAEFRRSIRCGTTNPRTYVNLGLVYEKKGQYKDAVYELERAIQISPDSSEAYNALGNVYVAMKKYPQALDAYRKAEHLAPNTPDIHYNLGIFYDDYMPDKGEALRHFQKYLDLTKSADKEVLQRMQDIIRENVR